MNALFEELVVIDDCVPRGGALNMAIDEALLRKTHSAILRFYRWKEPSVSFGYFGDYAQAHHFANGRGLVRRWTGGGIVPHGADVTYSILISRAERAYSFRAALLYRRIHELMRAVLGKFFAIETQLANVTAVTNSSACFAHPVPADLMEGSLKIAGAAQRKTRHGLLHQGSIQRDDLPLEFRGLFAQRLARTVAHLQLEGAILDEAGQLADEKYGTQAWLRRV